MTATLLELVPLATAAPTIRSSYMRGGKTRTPDGRIPRREDLLPMSSLKFKATRATARDLARLDVLMLARGGDLRLTEVNRLVAVQAAERAKYEAWVAAGKPDPGTPAFVVGRMRTTYVARPGASNHGWGGAFDLDVAALTLDGLKPGSNAALAAFWRLIEAEGLGFTPIIAEPLASMSESWHFDHWGPFAEIKALAARAGHGNPYGLASEVANVLAGVHPGAESGWRYVQARLLAGGFWCGAPDGDPGRMTRGALIQAGVTFLPEPVAMQARLIELGIGQAVLDAA